MIPGSHHSRFSLLTVKDIYILEKVDVLFLFDLMNSYPQAPDSGCLPPTTSTPQVPPPNPPLIPAHHALFSAITPLVVVLFFSFCCLLDNITQFTAV